VNTPDVKMLNKLNRVIQLCKTDKQLDGARKYCQLYYDNILMHKLRYFDFDNLFLNYDIKRMLNDDIKRKQRELNGEV